MQAQTTKPVRDRPLAMITPAQQATVTAAMAAPAGPPEQRVDAIRQAAHVLYDARGGANGLELEDWLKAEAEVDAQARQERADPSPAAASASTRS